MSLRPRISRLLAPMQAPLAAALLAMLIVLVLPGSARTTIPGAGTTPFAAALSDWLADDEGSALTALSQLARQDNRAAQILLALIDKTPSLQGPWLAQLPRAERIELLRAPGGISGQSWLGAAADHPLAETWLRLFNVDAEPSIIEAFRALGEARAAREALIVLAAREHPGLRGLDPASVDPELLYLLWRDGSDERRAAILALVPEGHPQQSMMGLAPQRDALEEWLMNAPAAAPLRAVCAATCADSMASCVTGAYAALRSHNALLTLGTPAEMLVSQEAFLDSPRGQASVLRRILQSTDARGRRAMITEMHLHDQCLADLLRDEEARYRYRRPGSENGVVEADAAREG